jgi:hypothetical protein
MAVAAFAMAAAAHSATIHVKPDGNDANSGASWDQAKQTIGAAIQAGNLNDEIWVAAGTYNERIRNKTAEGLSVDMALYGGFARAVCEQSGGAANSWTDGRPDPSPGDGRYYLVRAGNPCGDGGWGAGRVVSACP